MASGTSDKQTVRFLNFANTEEDAEKEKKLKEAAATIEQAIAKEKTLTELVDYKEPNPEDETFDPANDTRSLFERLQEQKNKKKEAIEESQKLSNMVTKLDEDDANYLNEVAKNKREEEVKKRLEVYDAMETKKRLDEQKLLEKEKRLKESLRPISSTSSDRPRLSIRIKLKPKNDAPKSNDEPPQKKQAKTKDE